MATLKQIMCDYGPEYVQRFGDTMPPQHRKVIDTIINCRTDYFGVSLYRCDECGHTHMVFRSCGNRHCPHCQGEKTRQWLSKRLAEQLPVNHFMITFTMPETIRSFIRSHQRQCYGAMFEASSQTLKTLACDEKYIGADLPGFFGVLHTWGRKLPYHPHIHYIVPAGGLSKADGCWRRSRDDFFLPVRAMSKIFRAKFRDAMQKCGLASSICPDVWKQAFVVDCRMVGAGPQCIKYLAPYVFRVAISNSRIIKVENRQVFFKYKKQRSNRWRTMSLEVMDFLHRFLQHVLPSGFMKVRYYGFMSPGSSVSMQSVANSIERCAATVDRALNTITIAPFVPKCEKCGGNLTYFASFVRFHLPPTYETG
jgi:predicted Zn-ribbon and HTH transcriptional regulator